MVYTGHLTTGKDGLPLPNFSEDKPQATWLLVQVKEIRQTLTHPGLGDRGRMQQTRLQQDKPRGQAGGTAVLLLGPLDAESVC